MYTVAEKEYNLFGHVFLLGAHPFLYFDLLILNGQTTDSVFKYFNNNLLQHSLT